MICWLLLGSAILNRLFTRPALAGPGGLSPAETMIGYLLGGYAVLMVLARLRLSLVYSGLSFGPGFWAFTFSYAAVVADALA